MGRFFWWAMSADPRCVFLSDVHLTSADPAKTARFLEFLRGTCGRIERLYLLGDLFDYWIGPRHIALPDYRPVLAALRGLAGSGVHAAFLPGNRDYHVGPEFARAAGVEILSPVSEATLGGRRVYLAHGDFLFNRNPRYTAYRRIAGGRGFRRAFAGLPTGLAARIVTGFRGVSRRETPASPFQSEAELLAPVLPLFARGFDVVVCGHLHRAAHHAVVVDGRPRDLFVLGEWKDGCPHVRYERGAFAMVGGGSGDGSRGTAP